MPLRETQKIAEEKLQPLNQGLILTGSAMKFADFVTGTYIPTYLPLLSSNTQNSYRGVFSKYLEPRFSHLCLRDLTRLTQIIPAAQRRALVQLAVFAHPGAENPRSNSRSKTVQ
jgi:hypothetical protein